MLSMGGRSSARRLRSCCLLLFWVWAHRRFRSPIPLQTSSLRLLKLKRQQVRFTRKSKHWQVRRLCSRLLRPIATLRLTPRLKSMALRITPRHRYRRKTHPALLRRTRFLRLRLVMISQVIKQARRLRLRRRTRLLHLKPSATNLMAVITFISIQRSWVTLRALH